ncbi:MAG TPA: hypothetical protein EYH01_02890 [Campylobacterales bacterium]|nr:hypothetical protein [Campylobacterales bacterium]
MIKYGYEARRSNTLDVDYGFETKKEAFENAPKGWNVIVFSYDEENEDKVAKLCQNGSGAGVYSIDIYTK